MVGKGIDHMVVTVAIPPFSLFLCRRASAIQPSRKFVSVTCVQHLFLRQSEVLAIDPVKPRIKSQRTMSSNFLHCDASRDLPRAYRAA